MKVSHKIMSMVILCVSMFMISTTSALASSATSGSYTGELGSIIIDYTYNDDPLDDVDFKLYKIASSQNDTYTMTEKFADYSIDFKSLESEAYWISVRNDLENYIGYKNIMQDMDFVTDNYGKYKVQDLEPGMYYIDAENMVKGDKEFFSEPILIMVGYYYHSEEKWLYHFTVEPKIAVMPFTGDYSIKVRKTWDNVPTGVLLPEYIEVELYRDGLVYDTVKLNAENKWTWTWDNIDEESQWGVLEKTTLKDYVVSYDRTFYDFEITNKYIGEIPEIPDEPDKPSPDKLPQTGTSANQIPLFAGLGVVLISCGTLISKRGKEDEA